MARVAVQLGNFETRLTVGPPWAGRPVLTGVACRDPGHPDLLAVPSLVHLAEPVLLGQEVLARGLEEAEATFHDFKDHVLHPLPGGRRVGGRRVTHKEAASVFLGEVVRRLRRDLGDEDLDLAVLFPLRGREAVCSWLAGAELPEVGSLTPVDEDTAAAVGYGVDPGREDLILVFDFGFSSVRARVLQFRWNRGIADAVPLVRGSVILSVGYADLALRLRCADPSSSLWEICGVGTGGGPEAATAESYEGIDGAAEARRALRLVLDEARLEGVDPRDLDRVLLLGSGGRSRAVREVLRETFGDRVLADLPLVSPLRGGIALLDGSASDERVRETLHLRVRDPATGEYDFPVVVESHTSCPSPGPTASYVVNTYYDGQKAMDLRLFRAVGGESRWEDREVVFGDDGRIGFVGGKGAETHEPALESPLVIPVDPPGRAGQQRFRLEFRVDPAKKLLVTVEDLLQSRVVWSDHPLLGLR